ncbi:hypothetical protein D3C80_2024070 [compost metagenome]
MREAKVSNDAEQLRNARVKDNVAKVALVERGPVWWSDSSPDYNRMKAIDTPYADWYATLRDPA